MMHNNEVKLPCLDIIYNLIFSMHALQIMSPTLQWLGFPVDGDFHKYWAILQTL